MTNPDGRWRVKGVVLPLGWAKSPSEALSVGEEGVGVTGTNPGKRIVMMRGGDRQKVRKSENIKKFRQNETKWRRPKSVSEWWWWIKVKEMGEREAFVALLLWFLCFGFVWFWTPLLEVLYSGFHIDRRVFSKIAHGAGIGSHSAMHATFFSHMENISVIQNRNLWNTFDNFLVSVTLTLYYLTRYPPISIST